MATSHKMRLPHFTPLSPRIRVTSPEPNTRLTNTPLSSPNHDQVISPGFPRFHTNRVDAFQGHTIPVEDAWGFTKEENRKSTGGAREPVLNF